MYEAFFNLRERPFTAAPSAERYFPASAIENARKTLARSIDRASGAGLIIGPTGTGKTLLCMALARQFQDQFATVLLASGRLCTRRALLQAILFELGLPYRGLEEGELRLSLMDYLSPAKQSLAGLLLVVDEAHSLPWRLVEELRMISNLVRDGKPRVRLVLAGSPVLEERFANPKLESFSQRLSARCYLESLDRSETVAYVRSEIAAAGGEAGKIFSDAALESVYRASDGIPRLINQVCDHALILAELGGSPLLTPAIIEEAWADLQQLPNPWQQGEKHPASDVVEFGGLDEPRDSEPAEDEREFIPFRTADTANVAAPNPDQQFDRIQAQLAEIEDDFQPAGSIGPEVELVFNGLRDPFGESFQEEEVVLDRYASLDADVFGQRPQVSSREGRELSALLGPYINKTAEENPQSEIVSADLGEMADCLEPNRFDAAPPASQYSTSDPKSFSGIAAEQEPPTVGMYRTDAEDVAEPDDSDLIVVEDGWLENLGQVRAAPLVRRQEYRQLFAKLRRG